MPDPAERFLKAAVLPLADNAELQVLTEQELRTALVDAPAGKGDSLEAAASHLEQRRPRRWLALLYAVAAIASIVAAIPIARDYARYRLASLALFAMSDPAVVALPGLPIGTDADHKVPALLGSFTPDEQLLLFGTPSAPFPWDKWKPLWQGPPSDLAGFSEYVRAHGMWPLPHDYLKTADRLDPGNGWFRHYAAGFPASGAVEPIRGPLRSSRTAGLRPRYRIKDPAKLEETITLLEEASRQPRYDSYEHALLLRRLVILPPGRDMLERKLVAAYLETEPENSIWIHRQIAQAVVAKAQEQARAGDAAGFLNTTGAWETMVRRALGNPGLSWPMSGFIDASTELAAAAKHLGLEEEASRHLRISRDLESRAERWKTARSQKPFAGPDATNLIHLRAGLENPPPLAESDLRPGLMAAKAMTSRISAAVVGATLWIALLFAALLRFGRGFQTRRLSASLVEILRPSDHAWIILGGVIAPIAIHTLAGTLRPGESGGFIESGGWVRELLLIGWLLTLPCLIAARRLGRRLACLGWNLCHGSETIWLGTATITLGLSGIGGAFENQAALAIGAALAIVLVVLGLLIFPIGLLFNPRATATRWVTCGRAIGPALAAGALWMALSTPLHHAREKHWTERNTLTRIDHGVPAMNRHEHELAETLQAELLEILDRKP